MQNSTKATPESQLFGAVCPVQDTEEMFWLRQTDDYQSKCRLAGLLVGQYRYREAICAYEEAERIRCDDPALYLRLGGANLTLFRFEPARRAYGQALDLGAEEKAVSYPLGVWHYLRGEYAPAAERFAACLPCDNELKIAVLYWHMLSMIGAGQKQTLQDEFLPDMDAGHHGAYKLAVSAICGHMETNSALLRLNDIRSDLDFVVAAYGLAVLLRSRGDTEGVQSLLDRLLARKSVWPCISYLAALCENRGATITNGKENP